MRRCDSPAAKIVAVVDVFDAWCIAAPTREPWPINEALTYIRDRAGSQLIHMWSRHILDVVAKIRRTGSI